MLQSEGLKKALKKNKKEELFKKRKKVILKIKRLSKLGMLSKSELPSTERKQKIESIYLFHKSNLSMYSTSAQCASKSCSSSPTTSKCRCLICISDKNILRSFPKRTK